MHWYRNVFRHVSREMMRKVAAMRKAIHAQEERATAESKARDVVAKLSAASLRKAADLVERSVVEALSYYAFPEPHWRRIGTDNPLERIIREIRRRTRVVGSFPDGESALNLAAVRRRHIAGTHRLTRRYLDLPAATEPSHIGDRLTRSRRLTQCAKDSGQYPRNALPYAGKNGRRRLAAFVATAFIRRASGDTRSDCWRDGSQEAVEGTSRCRQGPVAQGCSESILT